MLGQTTNLIINLDRDDWILDDDSKLLMDVGFGKFQQPRKTLCRCIAENETEISLFNRELYETFKANPEVSSTPASPFMAECVSDSLVTYARHPGVSGPWRVVNTLLSLWPNLWRETRMF